MRTKEEIQADANKARGSRVVGDYTGLISRRELNPANREDLMIELLLDIRELLISQQKNAAENDKQENTIVITESDVTGPLNKLPIIKRPDPKKTVPFKGRKDKK